MWFGSPIGQRPFDAYAFTFLLLMRWRLSRQPACALSQVSSSLRSALCCSQVLATLVLGSALNCQGWAPPIWLPAVSHYTSHHCRFPALPGTAWLYSAPYLTFEVVFARPSDAGGAGRLQNVQPVSSNLSLIHI